MKKVILVTVFAALAACSQPETAEEAEAPAETTEAVPANIAADGLPSVGMYKVTAADGSVTMEDVRADGTYVSTAADGKESTGKWEQKSPDSYCVTPDEAGATQKCYEEAVDANGVYTSKDPDTGEVSTVERVVS